MRIQISFSGGRLRFGPIGCIVHFRLRFLLHLRNHLVISEAAVLEPSIKARDRVATP